MQESTTAAIRRLLTVREAAERSGLAIVTIRRAITRGDLTGYRYGRRILRVDANELDELFTADQP